MAYGVSYPLSNGFCNFVLHKLNEQREEGSLCDITLKVQGRNINAHRGVLSACSDYFSAMFCGSYMESDSKVIDLSETFHSVEAVECLIESMYRGVLEVKKSDDICDLLETASILLFEDAKKQCIDCLKTRLCLRNGLKFWFAADRYVEAEHSKRFRSLVESHFHDYYIFQPEMLKMSARDLSVVFQQNFHTFCTPIQLLNFLLPWYVKGHTQDDLESIINQLHGSVFCRDHAEIEMFLTCPERLAKEFSLNVIKCSEFCAILKKLYGDFPVPSIFPKPLAKEENSAYISNICDDKTAGPCSSTSIHTDMLFDSESLKDLDAVLVFAPTPHILEQRYHLYTYPNQLVPQENPYSGTVPLLHVSVYLTQKRTWLQLGEISSPPKLTGKKLTGYFDSSFLEYCNGQLYVIGESGETNMRCDLETFQWHRLPPIKPYDLVKTDVGKVRLTSRERIVQPIRTGNGLYAAVASQMDEVVHLGLLQLVEPVGKAPSSACWVEKVPFEVPAAFFGFTLITACHCVREDRFIYVLFIGRMQSVHCRATCLAKFDILKETVAFLPVPEEYLMEPYHWTLFEQKGVLYLAHKTTFLYRLQLQTEGKTWENCSELVTIKGDYKLPSLYAKSWGRFRRLNGVSASENSLWVMVERRLVDRWYAITLWEVQLNMDSLDAQQEVIRHVPSPYSCYSLAVPVKLPVRRLRGLEICQCIHAE